MLRSIPERWLSKSVFIAIVGIGAPLAAGCVTQDPEYAHRPGPQAGMLEQMRAHHRCVEGETAKRQDSGRVMPDRSEMAAMTMHGGMQSGESAPTPAPPGEHHNDPDAPSGR
jgi:hypothetical protein